MVNSINSSPFSSCLYKKLIQMGKISKVKRGVPHELAVMPKGGIWKITRYLTWEEQKQLIVDYE